MSRPFTVTRAEARELKRRSEGVRRQGGIPHEVVRREWLAEMEGRIRDLERKTLDARTDLAEKRRDEAAREVKLAQSQRKLFATQLKLLAAR